MGSVRKFKTRLTAAFLISRSKEGRLFRTANGRRGYSVSSGEACESESQLSVNMFLVNGHGFGFHLVYHSTNILRWEFMLM